MLHNNLKTQFQAKEQELFQIHLQHNSYSRNLFEQVLRKNNQIIRICLEKFNELYNRFEQYDSNFNNLNQQIGKMHEINNNFHYQFRRTHLENQKKQTHLTNDILMLKNAMRIPSKNTPTEVYLQSQFFKSRINKMHQRKRQNGQSQNQLNQNSNSSMLQSSLKENSLQIDEGKQSQIIEGALIQLSKTSYPKPAQKQNSGHKKYPKQMRLNQIQDKLKYEKQIETLMNNSVMKDQLDCKLMEIKKGLQQKIDIAAITDKKQCRINNVFDFDEINKYIDQKIIAGISQKVTKQYLEKSLSNLKEAWEAEQKNIYEQLQSKAQARQIQFIQKEIKEIWQQIRQVNKHKKTQFNHNFNKSCNFPSQNISPRSTFRQQTSAENKNQCLKNNTGQIKESLKKNLAFSNSLSLLKSPQRKKHKNVGIDNLNIESLALTDKAWKQRVIEVLGSTTIKRTKVKN